MDRRTFIGGVAGGVFACNRIAHAQQSGKLWRVGFLQGSARPPDGAPPAALRNQLQALGFEQGKDIVYDRARLFRPARSTSCQLSNKRPVSR